MASGIKDVSLSTLRLSLNNLIYLAAAVSLLLLIYWWALPKPIPGIPYDESATRTLLGSLPEINAHIKKTGRLRPWLYAHNQRHNSAITQIWTSPLSKPSVLLADFQETQDVLLRRTKEFDREHTGLDVWRNHIKEHHIAMTTTDPRFKGNKELVKDLMTPTFLHEVSVPQIYAKTMTLIELWVSRTKAADGRPFSATDDIYDAAVDIINAVAFGLDDSMSILKAQLDNLTTLSNTEFPVNANGSVEFPRVPYKSEIEAVRIVTEHVGEQFKTFFPVFNHYYDLLTHPTLSKSIVQKNKLIHDEIEKSLVRLRNGEDETRSAMDHILQREMRAATKDGRKPEFHSMKIYDELFGYVLGGHETTYSALCWLIKNIADYPAVQEKLRSALQSAFAMAYDEDRQPSAVEICKSTIPYLDAVIEENLRLDTPAPVIAKEATVDTILLGKKIPKGTVVFMISGGPDFRSPPLPVPDEVRSETSRLKNLHARWDPNDIHMFKPERWLKVDDDGREVYEATAGPFLSFSGGPRGCFGKRLAYLEMRIVTVLLLWNFKFHKLSDELSSHDVVDKLTPIPTSCYVALSKADSRL